MKQSVVLVVLLCFLVLGVWLTPVNAADSLKFELFDVFGRKVCSEDYAGVPLFLEFGACW